MSNPRLPVTLLSAAVLAAATSAATSAAPAPAETTTPAEAPSGRPGLLAAEPLPTPTPEELVQPWLNANLIAWDGDILPVHRLARNLGHDMVADPFPHDEPGGSLATAEDSRDLGFYTNDPHKDHQPPFDFELDDATLAEVQAAYPYTFRRYPVSPRAIDSAEVAAMRDAHPEVFAKFKAQQESLKAWADADAPFPDNLAQLQQWGDGTRWEPSPDFQQQAVIDAYVKASVDYIRDADDNDFGYRFQGLVIDVIEPWREFDWQSDRPLPGSPATERAAVLHEAITHEYPTYRAGWYAYLAQLHDALQDEFPDRQVRCIWEPTPVVDVWVEPLLEADYPGLTDEVKRKILGDALVDEKPGLTYLTDPVLARVLPPHRLGTASGDLFTKDPHYPTQLTYLGEISSRGGYFMSYGTFDRSRRPVAGYPNQFKLIRALSAWQNQAATPVEARTWDASQGIYHSPTAHADAHAIGGLHPKNGRLYAVLLDADARLHLAEGVTAGRLRGADALWAPTEDAPAAEVVDGVLRPTADASFPVSVIAEVQRPEGGDLLALPPGVSLAQDRSTTTLPNGQLLDPDFEDGGQGWFATGTARLQAADEGVAAGSSSVRVTRRSQPWNCLSQDITGVLMNYRQGRYRVTAHVKPARTDGTVTIGYRFFERGERDTGRTKDQPVEAGRWTPVTAEFDLTWGDWIEEGRLLIVRNDSTEDYLVDDVTLEYLGR